jgi:hypothetical protein
VTRDAFFLWINSHRTPQELIERGDALAELIGGGLAEPIHGAGDGIETICLTSLGHDTILPMLPVADA